MLNNVFAEVQRLSTDGPSETPVFRGTRITLMLDIHAKAADGFPTDVESIVRDKAASLRITDFGFEGE